MIRLRMADLNQHKCIKCSHGRVTMHKDGHITTHCNSGMNTNVVYGTVVQCNKYEFDHDYAPSNMIDIAWVLEVRKGRVVGFKPPKDKSE